MCVLHAVCVPGTVTGVSLALHAVIDKSGPVLRPAGAPNALESDLKKPRICPI